MTLQTKHAVGQTLVGCGSLIVPFSFKLSSPALAPLRPQINWVKTTELSPITYSVRPSALPRMTMIGAKTSSFSPSFGCATG